MEAKLLGTGSADGWPNPFCRCASCNSARDSGDIRGNTSALIDGVLLVDCGRDTPRAAARQGQSLHRVHTMLITHNHPDHLDPAALLYRTWSTADAQLVVAGPPAAIELCRPWIGPDDPVTLTTLRPGDRFVRGGYDIRALAATHEGPEVGPAVIYDVTGPDGDRLLYATDTGPLTDVTLRELDGAEFDIALVEETFGARDDLGTGHLNLSTFAATIAALRASGAITATTQVVAIHLSHHNPPLAELKAQLVPIGALVLSDGDCIGSGARMPTPATPERTLVVGGARSGKSTYAEHLVRGSTDITYVATAPHAPEDPEWQDRIAAHQARRPSHWHTLETIDLVSVLRGAAPGSTLLIDCLTLWLTQTLDRSKAWTQGGTQVERHVADLVRAWTGTNARVVAVTNEVGSGVVPHTPSGRLFRDWQGKMNAQLAAHSDAVTLVVAGRPIPLAPVGPTRPAEPRSTACRST